MAAPGVKLTDLKRVRSTLQSLNQCEKFISQRGLEALTSFDTAGSARDLAAHPEPDLGVIASQLAAEIYHLDILQEEIEDAPFNYTRFFVLGSEDPPRAQRCKTSLIFSARHLPGSLYHCLGEFAERNINLTKIEIRPAPQPALAIPVLPGLRRSLARRPGRGRLIGSAAPGRAGQNAGVIPHGHHPHPEEKELSGLEDMAEGGAGAMIIVMQPEATLFEIDNVVAAVQAKGWQTHLSAGSGQTIIGLQGQGQPIDPFDLGQMPGVQDVTAITQKYKLASRAFRPENTTFNLAMSPLAATTW